MHFPKLDEGHEFIFLHQSVNIYLCKSCFISNWIYFRNWIVPKWIFPKLASGAMSIGAFFDQTVNIYLFKGFFFFFKFDSPFSFKIGFGFVFKKMLPNCLCPWLPKTQRSNVPFLLLKRCNIEWSTSRCCADASPDGVQTLGAAMCLSWRDGEQGYDTARASRSPPSTLC